MTNEDSCKSTRGLQIPNVLACSFHHLLLFNDYCSPHSRDIGVIFRDPTSVLTVCPQERTFPFETWASERPCRPTSQRTGVNWGCHTATTRSAWARTQTQRRTASCRRSTRSDYGAAATPSPAAARASPAGPTPISPSRTPSTRTQRTVGLFSLSPLSACQILTVHRVQKVGGVYRQRSAADIAVVLQLCSIDLQQSGTWPPWSWQFLLSFIFATFSQSDRIPRTYWSWILCIPWSSRLQRFILAL